MDGMLPRTDMKRQSTCPGSSQGRGFEKEEGRGQALILRGRDGNPVHFDVMPSGIRGFEWLLLSDIVALKIGNWPTHLSHGQT
jgi:hypothetical protein